MTNMKDFEDKEGNVDWKAYNKAEVETGERCYNCEQFIGFGIGHKKLCYECKCLDKKESLRHFCLIRCPKCKHTEDVRETDSFELYSEGEHSNYCSECNYEFEIQTHIEHTFESPELLDANQVKEGEGQ